MSTFQPKAQSNHTDSIMPQPIISAQHLTQSIPLQQKTLTIFENLNVDIFAGELVAITGRSGSGKSTLLGILATLDQASSGELWINGEAVHTLNEEQRALVRLRHIGFIFQSFQLLPHLSALENVMLPLRLQPQFHYAEAEQKALQLLKRVGLERQSSQTPKVLSGGEQQRVAIARALITEPKIIFADEPTGNLHSKNSLNVFELFKTFANKGTTIIVATHDKNLAELANKIYEVKDGKIE